MIFSALSCRTGLIALHIGLLVLLPGCSTLPAFGPSADDITQAAEVEASEPSEVLPFRLMNISTDNIPADVPAEYHFPWVFLEQGFLADDEYIGVSDVLELRIWEAADDGLFAVSGQRETVLSVSVSNTGVIEVPYAGRISVAGLNTSEVRRVLLERFRGQAIDPEISVVIADTSSRTVAVLGAVRNSGRVIVPSNGIHLFDLMAQAGGVAHASWEVKVTVSRGSHSGNLMLDQVYQQPPNNIVILPGDSVQVTHIPRRFAVYGAVSRPGNTELNIARPSLSTLLAEVGGLKDMQAEPNSVFVFRRAEAGAGTLNPEPVAYRVDFARPDAFLLADRFKLDASDIVYVATADASEFRKLASTLLSPLVGSANGIQDLGN